MNILLIIILSLIVSITYWSLFNSYCQERFYYCYKESSKPNGECGVYYIDKWEYSPFDFIINFGLSFVRCDGVLD